MTWSPSLSRRLDRRGVESVPLFSASGSKSSNCLPLEPGRPKMVEMSNARPTIGVVLSGGGSRGAYEAGIIRFVREGEPLGTAGSLRLIDDLPANFLVVNGDVFTTLDFGRMFDSHIVSESPMTIATHKKNVKVQLGVLERENDLVTAYIEKPTYDFEVSMGVYGYTDRAVSFIPENSYFDFPDLVHSLIDAGEQVRCHPSEDDWLDIGNPDDYGAAQQIFAESPERYVKSLK